MKTSLFCVCFEFCSCSQQFLGANLSLSSGASYKTAQRQSIRFLFLLTKAYAKMKVLPVLISAEHQLKGHLRLEKTVNVKIPLQEEQHVKFVSAVFSRQRCDHTAVLWRLSKKKKVFTAELFGSR